MILESENALIDFIVRTMPETDRELVRVGVGDDAAVLRTPGDDVESVLTTDQVIENKHFKRIHPPSSLGAKMLARVVSDVAAMGGRPRWYLLSLCVGEWCSSGGGEAFLRGLFQKVQALQAPGLSLVGGDLARGDQFSAHISVGGEVPSGRALLRSEAREGDSVYVSGSLGGSALGLERLLAGERPDDPAVLRHIDPEPRLGLGTALRQSGARAAMDLSDGLSIDAGRLANASGVGIELQARSIPRFPGASEEQALHGGEEYELLFTAPPGWTIPAIEDLAVTRIGRCVSGQGVFLRRGKNLSPLVHGGFDHFSTGSGDRTVDSV